MLGQYCELYSELSSIMVSKIHCTKMMVICYFMENTKYQVLDKYVIFSIKR